MVKNKKKRNRQYVPHPRYGSEPIQSNFTHFTDQRFPKEKPTRITEDSIRASFWGYSHAYIFPETAIPADITKQNDPVFPRFLYVDIQQQCRTCDRWFIFFAQEQKYWYENLSFNINADCVNCIECRKQDREIKNMHLLYQELLKKELRTDKEHQKLKQVALELYELGFIKNIEKINDLK